MEEFKSYLQFKESVLKHLSKDNPQPWGIFAGNGEPYPHIVYIPEGRTQEEIIREILRKDEVNPDLFTSPHRYAHHLNSSQVVCYEYFRNLITEEKRIKNKLVDCLNSMGLPGDKFSNGYAEFEWVPFEEENTNFDFYIQGQDPAHKVYFEIKYTEQGFGACKNDDTHRQKFDTIYKDMIENCACLLKKPTRFDENWINNYQLFRNVLRVTIDNWENEFVVFLFPKMNKRARNHFETFRETYIDPAFDTHIKEIFWEDLSYMTNIFRNKFFYYTI